MKGSRLKLIRKSLNMKQTQFAERLGLNQGSYSSIESGKTNVSQQVSRALLREFCVNPEYIESGKGDMFLLDSKELNSRVNELLKIYGLSMDEFFEKEFGGEVQLSRTIKELKAKNQKLEDRVDGFARQILMYERLLAEKEEKFSLLKAQYDHLKDSPL